MVANRFVFLVVFLRPNSSRLAGIFWGSDARLEVAVISLELTDIIKKLPLYC